MNATLELLSPKIFSQRRSQLPITSYLWSTLILGIGLTFGLHHQTDIAAFLLFRISVIVSVVITGLATVRWGNKCGFAIEDKQDNLSLTNILRHGAMTLVMFSCVTMVSVLVVSAALTFFS